MAQTQPSAPTPNSPGLKNLDGLLGPTGKAMAEGGFDTQSEIARIRLRSMRSMTAASGKADEMKVVLSEAENVVAKINAASDAAKVLRQSGKEFSTAEGSREARQRRSDVEAHSKSLEALEARAKQLRAPPI